MVAAFLSLWSGFYFGYYLPRLFYGPIHNIILAAIAVQMLMYYVYCPVLPFVVFYLLQRGVSIEFKEIPIVIVAVVAGAVIGVLLGDHIAFASLGLNSPFLYYLILGGPETGIPSSSRVVLVLSSLLGLAPMFFRAADEVTKTRGYTLRFRRHL